MERIETRSSTVGRLHPPLLALISSPSELHKEQHGLLAELAPSATIDPSARFHDQGKILTAAGISAGIDAALHVVGRFLGEPVAIATAEEMEYRR